MSAAIPNRSGSIAAESGITAGTRREFAYRKYLFLLFLISFPLINPIVHGDGVGYYAYARAPLIRHNLRFEEDWQRANTYFSSSRVQDDQQLNVDQYTSTGYVGNHFTVGPAMLWAPFLIVAHVIVLLCNALGAHIGADGFSSPYLVAMALGSAIYGFLGLLLSFSLARKYVQERWAFLATVGIWLATSLPVYMYFNPAWSHAHSAFAVALFLWYWDRTRVPTISDDSARATPSGQTRSLRQWIVLGFIAGLMIDVYFPNGVFLLLPMIEAILAHWQLWRAQAPQPAQAPQLPHTEQVTSSAQLVKMEQLSRASQFWRGQMNLIGSEVAFVLAILVALVPTFITRRIIYGSVLRFGEYTTYPWRWSAPHWREVLFSTDHGLLSWTPILALAIAGFFLAPRRVWVVSSYLICGGGAFYYVIACYPFWDGLASFGNRFFISVTPVFIFGLAILFERVAELFRDKTRAFLAAVGLVVALAAWNAGFIIQWGEHLVPVRGPISFRTMVHNQLFVVPRELTEHLRGYLFRRKDEMKKIERRDIEQMKTVPTP